MNILIVVAAHGFQDEELVVIRRELEAALHHVTIASSQRGDCVGVSATTVKSELALANVHSEAFDGAVFVGGPGSRAFFEDPHAQRIAREMVSRNKVTGAIGVAPVILARAGVLSGRRATVDEAEVKALITSRALVRALAIVADGHLITSNGSGPAWPFAKRVVEELELWWTSKSTQLERSKFPTLSLRVQPQRHA